MDRPLGRNSKENKVWRRPHGKDDIQDTEEIQIVPDSVCGEWDLAADEPTFVISNDSEIHECFESVFVIYLRVTSIKYGNYYLVLRLYHLMIL